MDLYKALSVYPKNIKVTESGRNYGLGESYKYSRMSSEKDCEVAVYENKVTRARLNLSYTLMENLINFGYIEVS